MRKRMTDFFNTYFIIFIVLGFVGAIVIYPEESVAAAYNGLMTWFTIVLPSLLPFFIGSHLLIGLGVVKFMGVVLEPIMRPIFNVPGVGSFAFAMSITSGYPVGAKVVTNLRQDKLLTQVEAQRLASFCSTSGPLFMIGAVSVGMFHSSEVGVLLSIAHYLAAISVGVLFRFYKRTFTPAPLRTQDPNLFKRAVQQLEESRKNNPSFGLLMGNAVKESFNTMLVVGGFIILFSVVINIVEIIGLVQLLAQGLFYLLKPLQMNMQAIKGLITGLFEITIGSKLIAESQSVPLVTKIAATSFVIAWSGFSIHAQVISIISSTDIRPTIYMASKLLHGLFSFVFIYLLYPIFTLFFTFTTTATNFHQTSTIREHLFRNFITSIQFFIMLLIILLLFMVFTSMILTILSSKKKKGRRY
ncbi:Sporulation integral membrane protein YlbJ [Alkaliphilus metalliredigens QYMF]|uniref:Sporulation integral membrane protein YlbJ n=1 Tax=Alkaliphilus metalliredigens (strain QYMF) TaxID=293826 RepID=A6TRU8_ALKMQ|nr:sporulation integral membrane protein YlbJ [Alkaliphilus metalliredigens]ABR48916.1 Sporulation integral membrane protein YlbJ [Alkaliphilus metalliredigens QYMF]